MFRARTDPLRVCRDRGTDGGLWKIEQFAEQVADRALGFIEAAVEIRANYGL